MVEHHKNVMEQRSTCLVHDYLLVMRGAERTFAALGECWPDAPIYTLLYDPQGTRGRFIDRDVRTSYLQHLGIRQSGFRRLLPLFPGAAERLPIERHGLVITSSSAFAHGVRPREGAVHVCYCYSPFRYAWYEERRALAEVPRLARPALRRTLARIRRWDLAASRRVTRYIAISEWSRRRIHDTYGRDATVVHPPVEIDRFSAGSAEDFLLAVTEFVPHKKVGLALEAAARAKQHIKVVGDGPELPRLRQRYGTSAEFLGRIDDDALARLYSRARALVIPNIEEFGITAVEAQAAGRPVVAADGGGARETVIPGETGVLVPPDDVDALAEAIKYTRFDGFSPQRLRENATRFSTVAFKSRLMHEVEEALAGATAP